MHSIIDIRLKEVEDRLSDRKITLDLDDSAKNFLLSSGYSPQYGARPLNRAIQSELLNPLSVYLLSGRILPNETAKVRFDGPRNRLYIVPNHAPTSGDGMDVDEDFDDDIEVEEMD